MADKCSKCPFKIAAEFYKPSIQECLDYAKSIGWNNFDSEQFYWYNEAHGWRDKNGQPYYSFKGIVQIWYRAAMRRGDIKEDGTKTFKERYDESGS